MTNPRINTQQNYDSQYIFHQMNFILLISVFLLVFIPANSEFNPQLALHLGYLSSAAYEPISDVESWTCSYCKKYSFESPKVFSHLRGGIQGYTGYSRDLNAVVVVFRGSMNLRNWLINFDGLKSPYPHCPNCFVHTGFLNGYNLVASVVRNTVKILRSKYTGAKLYVTGHSLGGALAKVCTADLEGVDLTYTFGQPRVGNKAFASWFQSRHINFYRVIHYADIVPHLSPAKTGYVHSNTQVWYKRGLTSYEICAAESPSCANSIGRIKPYSIDDHIIDRYIGLNNGLSRWISYLTFGNIVLKDLSDDLKQIVQSKIQSEELKEDDNWLLEPDFDEEESPSIKRTAEVEAVQVEETDSSQPEQPTASQL